MSGSHRHGSPGADAPAPGLLARWSERKRARAEDAQSRAEGEGREPVVVSSPPEPSPPESPQKVLTDQDMPPLETLNEESDYSGFLSPGVSNALHRMALRKLFGAAKFQSRDGLDDYDTDYNLLVPLRRAVAEVTQHMQRQIQDELQQTPAAAASPAADVPQPPATSQLSRVEAAPQLPASGAEAGATNPGIADPADEPPDPQGFRKASAAAPAASEGSGSAESSAAAAATTARER